jgi:DNA-binding NarL/FixJ family response regulator
MKILLIDDHPLILSAMRYVIRDLDEAVEVTGVESVVQARSVLGHNTDFDLILLDLYLGEVHGFDFLSELRLRHPAIPVVVISGSDRASDVIRAIDTGAMGFVPKRASNQLLFEALHLVMSVASMFRRCWNRPIMAGQAPVPLQFRPIRLRSARNPAAHASSTHREILAMRRLRLQLRPRRRRLSRWRAWG